VDAFAAVAQAIRRLRRIEDDGSAQTSYGGASVLRRVELAGSMRATVALMHPEYTHIHFEHGTLT
jgi:hypothetical protein